MATRQERYLVCLLHLVKTTTWVYQYQRTTLLTAGTGSAVIQSHVVPAVSYKSQTNCSVVKFKKEWKTLLWFLKGCKLTLIIPPSTGEDLLYRYLSNERIPTIAEESPAGGMTYRSNGDRTPIRSIDHIRSGRYLVNVDLHNSATIPYQEDFKKAPMSSTPKRPPAEPSLLVSWITRLKLLTHWHSLPCPQATLSVPSVPLSSCWRCCLSIFSLSFSHFFTPPPTHPFMSHTLAC